MKANKEKTENPISIPEITLKYKIFLIVAVIVAGTISTLTSKAQYKTKIDGEYFTHPFIQTFLMDLGEAMCFFAFLFQRSIWKEEYAQKKEQAKQSGLQMDMSPWYLLLPASLDCISSTFLNLALMMLDVSIYQMLTGGLIIFTAIFGLIWLKKKISVSQWIGIALVIIGLTIVGLKSVLYSSSSHKDGKLFFIFGIIFVICSLLLTSTQFTIEEKFFRTYYLEPGQAIGIEGMWGMGMMVIIIAIFHFIPFKYGILYQGKRYFERVDVFFLKFWTHWLVLFCIIVGTFGVGAFNYFSIAITKTISAIARVVLGISRMAVVWAIALALPNPSDPGNWETFHWLQLLGFIIMILGNIVYVEVFDSCIKKEKPKIKDAEENSKLLQPKTS